MYHDQPELELALLHIRQVEQRIADQEIRVARLRSVGGSTLLAEELLRTLQTSRKLLNNYLTQIDEHVTPDKMSR